ncbi:UNKNOWN [Stylonychia lemnae]|uniref:Uncharacterized protein n=1 Tax=Stylonychia lemnae TaxID=5949 RepID=A0A078AP43_STYLE|nr:UNKNOWN [Stylonychia lemnae]|eukprot:CDW82733.1 UNKNOWN [Stylonychia lemnae]
MEQSNFNIQLNSNIQAQPQPFQAQQQQQRNLQFQQQPSQNQSQQQHQPQNASNPNQNSAGAEAHLSSLKACFKQAANSLTSLYKQSTFSYNIAYQQGRQDAFEEVFQWFMAQNTNDQGEFKNVSKAEFFTYIQEKVNKQVIDTQKAHDYNQAFIQSLMPPPQQIRPSNMNGMMQEQFMGVNQNAASDLIELADNAIQEETANNGGLEIGKKFSINFNGLKLNDSKKRMRGPTFGSHVQQTHDNVPQRYDSAMMQQENYNEEMEISQNQQNNSGNFNYSNNNEQAFPNDNRKLFKPKRQFKQPQ